MQTFSIGSSHHKNQMLSFSSPLSSVPWLKTMQCWHRVMWMMQRCLRSAAGAALKICQYSLSSLKHIIPYAKPEEATERRHSMFCVDASAILGRNLCPKALATNVICLRSCFESQKMSAKLQMGWSIDCRQICIRQAIFNNLPDSHRQPGTPSKLRGLEEERRFTPVCLVEGFVCLLACQETISLCFHASHEGWGFSFAAAIVETGY